LVKKKGEWDNFEYICQKKIKMINEKKKNIFEVNEYDMKENEIFHSFINFE